jgi:hypothetical protein
MVWLGENATDTGKASPPALVALVVEQRRQRLA